ncbi:MAG TPA: hypothetical protein VI452_16925 [Marmoricola sp.]
MQHRPERPIDLEGVPTEEDVSRADAPEQLAQDPTERENLSGEPRQEQLESRRRLAEQLEDGTAVADRQVPEDR